VQYSHDRLIIVKPDRKSTVFSSRRNVVSGSAFLTDDGRLFHARAEAMGRHGHRMLNVWWTVPPAWLSQHSAERRRRRVDVRSPEQALSKVRRRCSMKTAVGQNRQPEYDSLRNSQPMEFTKPCLTPAYIAKGEDNIPFHLTQLMHLLNQSRSRSIKHWSTGKARSPSVERLVDGTTSMV